MKSYIFSVTHRKIWLDHPTPDDAELEHIAAALSGINRFTGLGFSDAQHCVLVSRLVPEHLAKWGLLHDACEAYLGDVSGPLKSIIGGSGRNEKQDAFTAGRLAYLPKVPTTYRELQDVWDEVIARRFNTPIADVKPWDELATLIEARDCGQLNPALSGAEQLAEWFDLPAGCYLCQNTAMQLARQPRMVRESAEDARAIFLARCAELGIE